MQKTDWCQQDQLDSLLQQHNCDDEDYRALLVIQSLTQGLERLNPNFGVTLLGLSEISLTEEYAQLLPQFMQKHTPYFSRRVILTLDEQPMIWAESLCNVGDQFWREYLHCGTQSLGRKLFNGEKMIERTEFMYRWCSLEMLPFDLSDYDPKAIGVIARQSIFTYANEKLCLTEWYLPPLKSLVRK